MFFIPALGAGEGARRQADFLRPGWSTKPKLQSKLHSKTLLLKIKGNERVEEKYKRGKEKTA